MMFEVGQHVKCFLRTSTVVEGIIQESSEHQLILKSLDGESLLIIHQPTQDIVLTKILLPKEEKKTFSTTILQKTVNEPVANDEDLKVLDQMALQAKTTAELKIELAKEERKIVAAKLRDHRPNLTEAPRKTTYGYPRFLKKPST